MKTPDQKPYILSQKKMDNAEEMTVDDVMTSDQEKKKILRNIFKAGETQVHISITEELNDLKHGMVSIKPDNIKEEEWDGLKKEIASVKPKDIEKAFNEQASTLEKKSPYDRLTFPNLKIKSSAIKDIIICCDISLQEINNSSEKNYIDVVLYPAKQFETKKFGELTLDMRESAYIEDSEKFFNELEKSGKFTVLRNFGNIDDYALLKCGEHIIPVSKFLKIINPGMEDITHNAASPYSNYLNHIQKMIEKFNFNVTFEERLDPIS